MNESALVCRVASSGRVGHERPVVAGHYVGSEPYIKVYRRAGCEVLKPHGYTDGICRNGDAKAADPVQ